jgi:hypothetical protein
MKPGETIPPGDKKQAADKNSVESAPKSKQKSTKAPTQKETTEKWEYNAEDTETEESQAPYVQPITWSAAEYIEHQKSPMWFATVFLAIVVATAIVYLITEDLISSVAILIIGVAFTAFAGRPPQTLEYSLDGTGVHIDTKSYPYSRFRSFAILDDQPVPTIMLIPIRRFDLPINLHFDGADGDKIVDILGKFLPGEQRNAPPVDRLMSKIRF